MPLYEYVCNACTERFEKLVRMSDDPQAVRCPRCASDLVARALSTFATAGGQRGSTTTSAESCGPVG